MNLTLDHLVAAVKPFNDRLIAEANLEAANLIIEKQNQALALAHAALEAARHDLHGAWYFAMPLKAFEADPTIRKIDQAIAVIRGKK
jgi:hypothetical protein